MKNLFEKSIIPTKPTEKKSEMETADEFSAKPETETDQEKELSWKFARELQETPKGQFFKKLYSLAASFAIAGIISMPATPEKSFAPTMTKEALMSRNLEYTKKHQPDVYKKILDQIQTKGGVVFSPDLPETIYRPEEIVGEVVSIAREQEMPFYNRPEVILGEKFIKENPDQARQYLEKINGAMKATVRIWHDAGIGSGVIIETAKGNFILTNAHVCQDKKIVFLNTSDKKALIANVLSKNENADLALLRISDGSPHKEAFEKMKGLRVEESGKFNPNEKAAIIGNPFCFPFAVGITQLASPLTRPSLLRYESKPEDKRFVAYEPDQRFSDLELYAKPAGDFEKTKAKGMSIPGMSGGPLIKLEAEGEPTLFGINQGFVSDKNNHYLYGRAIKTEEIVKFLRSNGLDDSKDEKT